MTIGDRIKELRKSLQLTQDELARRIDTTKQTIYKYENNIVTNIPMDKIEQLASILNTTPGILIGWSKDEENHISFFDFIEFVKSLGCNITPYESGNCKERSSNATNEEECYLVGCEDMLCIDCPNFIKSYKVTYNNVSLVVDFNNYIKFKDEVISFTKYKITELINNNNANRK